jgi:uncharacterized Fe-S cluster-containing MiaB family protein
VLSKFLLGAFSKCYSCDYGLTCIDGNMVKDNGFVDQITPEISPYKFDQQKESIRKYQNAAHIDVPSLMMKKVMLLSCRK